MYCSFIQSSFYVLNTALPPLIPSSGPIYSTDAGRDWQPCSEAAPTDRYFRDYVAPGDGTYWFAARSVDSFDQYNPPSLSQLVPERIVVVDTRPPAVSLRQVDDPRSGIVTVGWDVRDELQVALMDDPEPVAGFRQVSLGPSHPDPWWPIAGMGTGYLETSTNQIRDFLEAIVNGGSARPDFRDGTHVQRVVDAVIASAASGTWVDVPSVPAAAS